MTMKPERLAAAVDTVLPEVRDLRRTLHRFPEPAFREDTTAGIIRDFLSNLSLDIRAPLLGTDVNGIITADIKAGSGGCDSGSGARGESGRPAVLLRADMDALPIREKTGLPWSSERPGFAHSCGHDGHIAMLAGAVKVLCGLRGFLGGDAAFVFQPGEEQGGGGKKLVQGGILRSLGIPRAVFGIHGWPGLPEGAFASLPGPMMAADTRFSLTVEGLGGHGGKPHKTTDPIVAACSIVGALQTIVSRNVDPQSAVVLSVCSIHGGEADNVIPGAVVIRGTIRFFDEGLAETVMERMRRLSEGICAGFGMSCCLEFIDGYIPLVNDPDMVNRARRSIEETLGAGAWVSSIKPSMAAEDFSYYLTEMPGAFLWLGLGETWKGLHHPEFDFNDEVLKTGVMGLCSLALQGQASGGAVHG